MTKVYLAHSISTAGEYNDSKRVANEIRALGYEVYAAAENDSINDKSNEPTPIDIYNGDVSEIMSSDIFVVNLSGGHQDGTISEIGVVAGVNEMRSMWAKEYDVQYTEIPRLAYTGHARLRQPHCYEGIPSAAANDLVLGMIECWGGFCGDEEGMLSRLKKIGGDA